MALLTVKFVTDGAEDELSRWSIPTLAHTLSFLAMAEVRQPCAYGPCAFPQACNVAGSARSRNMATARVLRSSLHRGAANIGEKQYPKGRIIYEFEIDNGS